MNWRAAIPNALTLGNLACGFAAIVTSADGRFDMAALLIALAAVCDVLDGAVARLLRVASPLGVQLDSLADVVSFGVAPAVLLYQVALPQVSKTSFDFWLLAFCITVPLAAAYRLARFNVESDRKLNYFEGLPSPAAGLALSAAGWTLTQPNDWHTSSSLIGSHVILLCVLVSLTMISRYPYLSLKSKQWGPLIVVVLGAGISYALFRPLGVLAALLWYALVSRIAYSSRRTSRPPHAAQ